MKPTATAFDSRLISWQVCLFLMRVAAFKYGPRFMKKKKKTPSIF